MMNFKKINRFTAIGVLALTGYALFSWSVSGSATEVKRSSADLNQARTDYEIAEPVLVTGENAEIPEELLAELNSSF